MGSLGLFANALANDTIDGYKLFVRTCIKLKVIKSERIGGLRRLRGTCEWNDEDMDCQGAA